MEQTLLIEKDIAIVFAQATKQNDFNLITGLLSDQGEFQIQNKENDSVDVGKKEFLAWYKLKLQQNPITDIEFDQCIHCSVGDCVIIFNDGKFPRTLKDSSERSKTGLKLEVKDCKITELKFCYVFLKTQNKYEFECVSDKMRVLMKDAGLSFDEAYERVTGNDGIKN